MELVGQDASYAVFGSGCPGTNNLPPRLAHSDYPLLGSNFAVDLHDGRSNSVALLVTSQTAQAPIDLTFLGMPGCSLLVPLDVTSLVPTNTDGRGSFVLSIPNNPALTGAALEQQYFVLDPGANTFGMVASNAATGNVGTLPPQADMTNVQVQAGGDVIVATVHNIGTEPEDLCLRQMSPAGEVALFLAEAIVPGPIAGQAQVTFRRQLGPPAGLNMPVAMMRGKSSPVPFVSSPRLSAPQRAWVWRNGRGLVQDMTGSPSQINTPGGKPNCPPGQASYGVVARNINSIMAISFPTSICPQPSPIYPQGTKITLDFHGDVTCIGPGGGSRHYDMFLDTIEVTLASGAFYLQVAQELGTPGSILPPVPKGQIQEALDAAYPGEFLCEYDFVNNEILIHLVDPNCVWTRAGGTLHICCP